MRHVCVIILIHFLKRFQIDAFSIKTLRFSVDRASGPEVNVNYFSTYHSFKVFFPTLLTEKLKNTWKNPIGNDC